MCRARRPRDLGRSYRGTDRRTVRRGELEGEPTSASGGWLAASKHVVGNRREHQLGAAEHRELSLVVDGAPAQVDDIGRRAFLGRAGHESRRHRRSAPRRRESPPAVGAVTGHQIDNVPATLHADVDV